MTKININKKKIFDLFSKAIALGALYSLLLGVIKSLVNHDISYLFYHNLSNNLSNLSAIYFSVFVSFGICYYLIKTPKSRLDYFTILFLALFLILLSSKTIIAITIINSLILLFWKKTKIKFICKEHGEFEQSPACHLLYNGCKKCTGHYKKTNGSIWPTESIRR